MGLFEACANLSVSHHEPPLIVTRLASRSEVRNCRTTMSEKLQLPDDSGIPRRPIDDLKKYRKLVGHTICESLGYFTPRAALNVVLANRNGEPLACEWYSHISQCSGQGAFERGSLIEIIQRAFTRRRDHRGYMAEYERARAIVDHEIDGDPPSELASWF